MNSISANATALAKISAQMASSDSPITAILVDQAVRHMAHASDAGTLQSEFQKTAKNIKALSKPSELASYFAAASSDYASVELCLAMPRRSLRSPADETGGLCFKRGSDSFVNYWGNGVNPSDWTKASR